MSPAGGHSKPKAHSLKKIKMGCNVDNTRLLKLGPPIAQGQQQLVRVEGSGCGYNEHEHK